MPRVLGALTLDARSMRRAMASQLTNSSCQLHARRKHGHDGSVID
jgi:hypothetical protein